MVKKDKIICSESQPNVIYVNGKPYIAKKETVKIIDHKQHGGDVIFVPYDKRKAEADIEFIVNNIEQLLDKKEILREILQKETLDRIQKMRKIIEKKGHITRTAGCYGITIGNDSNGEYLQIA